MRGTVIKSTARHALYAIALWFVASFAISASVLFPSQGGTGVANNNAATITRSGNHALTITTTGTTGVTLPTSGTLATVGGNIGAATGTSLAATNITAGTATLDSTYQLTVHGSIDKATTTSESVAFFGSSDVTAPLGARVTINNNATAGSRTVDITSVEPGVTGRALTLNGNVTVSASGGNLTANGTIAAVTGGSANKATCWKTDGFTLGFCSTVVGATGGCTCN